MPRRTTAAALAGVGAGITLTFAATTNAPDNRELTKIIELTGERFLPALVLTIIALAFIKRWIYQHDVRTRHRFANLLGERQAFEELHQRRQRDLEEREIALRQAIEIHHLQKADTLRQVNETHCLLDAERAALKELQVSFDELADEHNTLIQQVMQDRADLFGRRSAHHGNPVATAAPISHLRPPPPTAALPDQRPSTGAGDAG